MLDPPGVVTREDWERCKGWIEAALEYAPTHGIEDVLREIVNGQATFWPGRSSAIVTQFNTYPRFMVCDFWLAGGDMTELVHEMQPQIEEWAKAQGVFRFTVPGRLGWARVLKPQGYEPVYTILMKSEMCP